MPSRPRETKSAADPSKLLKGLSRLGGEGPKSLPPAHLWNPPFCGDIPMVIKRDGTWLYQGSPIGRKSMVTLFSGILRRDDDGCFYLVTPVEKCGITVEDAPFVAVELVVEGEGRDQVLTFRTHVDDWVTADADHPVRVEIDPETEEPAPYILVRGRLEALISRPVFYDLVELGTVETVDGEERFGVWSAGRYFPFADAGHVVPLS
jgi:hypothetical protein